MSRSKKTVPTRSRALEEAIIDVCKRVLDSDDSEEINDVVSLLAESGQLEFIESVIENQVVMLLNLTESDDAAEAENDEDDEFESDEDDADGDNDEYEIDPDKDDNNRKRAYTDAEIIDVTPIKRK